MKYLVSFSILFFLIFACNTSSIKFEIDSGEYDRSNIPVTINTETKLDQDKNYSLQNSSSGTTYPVQVLSENKMVFMSDELRAGSKQTYSLIQEESASNQSPIISLKEEAEGVQVLVGNKPVLFYRTATAFPADTLPEYYKRSGFIHPLHSPNGKILTDDFPSGHVHQHALFNAWTNTTFKGNKVDFWNQQEELGTVEHDELLSHETGPVVGQMKSKMNHISLADGKILEEEWQITVYPVADYFLFDIFSEQTNTSEDTLFINEYHYGGMAFRGSREWNSSDSQHYTNQWKILTSEGMTLKDADHTKAKWVDASGTVEGNVAGLTVFGFPDNFRYPQSIRVHPEMPYWVYSPMVEGAFYIAPGQKYRSRFRYYVHDGLPDQNMLEKILNDLENPVKAREL